MHAMIKLGQKEMTTLAAEMQMLITWGSYYVSLSESGLDLLNFI